MYLSLQYMARIAIYTDSNSREELIDYARGIRLKDPFLFLNQFKPSRNKYLDRRFVTETNNGIQLYVISSSNLLSYSHFTKFLIFMFIALHNTADFTTKLQNYKEEYVCYKCFLATILLIFTMPYSNKHCRHTTRQAIKKLP